MPLIIISFISGSSGTVLAIFAGLGVILWAKFKRLRVWIVLVSILIPCLVAYKTGDFKVFNGPGRWQVWKRTVEVTNKHPQGYGLATYKLMFPIMSQDLEASKGALNESWEFENTKGNGLAWRRAHNFVCQLMFEYGYIGLILFVGWIVSIAIKLIREKSVIKLSGLVIVATNMMTAFPDRMTQSVLILLMFCAWCECKGVE